ncbi:uncharacterized protein VP01_4505g2 [Puccinia sorghi]|uniref:Uncharacterized protein n=1 Tax=Puccinia sorghi TaxID=27349 RepID=A0A0L6UP33_9BASI|nr:uncharacterized protein VP01_4505g2 [Puccinia sorghi]
MAIGVCGLATEFWDSVEKSYAMNKNTAALCLLLMEKRSHPELLAQLDEPWKTHQVAGRFVLLDGLLYHQTANYCSLVLGSRARRGNKQLHY